MDEQEKSSTEMCPDKNQDYDEIKKFGIGVRHLQATCMCLVATTLFVVRCSMGVAVLAMTDKTRLNDTNIRIYDWDKKTQGMILSSFFWGYMAMQVPAGLLAKRFGGKLIITVALVANGLFCLLLPVLADIGGWGMVCASRVAMGLTQACLFPASHTLFGRWLPDNERTSCAGVVYGGINIGTIIGLPLTGLLASTEAGWKLIFYAMAGLMLATAAVWQGLAASTPADHWLMKPQEQKYIEADLNTSAEGGDKRIPWREILTSLPMLGAVIAHWGCSAGFILFFVEIPSYFEHGLGISLKDSASLSALPYVGMWIGCVGSSLLCEKIINKGWLRVSVCRKLFNSIAMYGMTAGLAVLCCFGPEHKAYAIVTLVITLCLFGSCSAGFQMSHLDLSPNYGGVMYSISNFTANSFAVAIPIINGYILGSHPDDVSRWRKVFLMVAIIGATCNSVYVWLGNADKQPWDHPDWRRVPLSDPEEMKTKSKGKEESERN